MTEPPVGVTREQLHDMVWTTPVRLLATAFGLSDVGLAKLCRSHSVPLPYRGYWARVRAGQKPRRTLLPKRKGDHNVVIPLRRVAEPAPPEVKPDVPQVPVPSDLTAAHSVLRTLGKALRGAPVDDYERMIVGGRLGSTLAVTAATHRRALLLLDGLAKGATNRGHTFAVREAKAQDETRRLVIARDEYEVEIGVHEQFARKPHVATEEEKRKAAQPWGRKISEYDRYPNGRLQLVMFFSRWSRKTISDTESRNLEDMLGRVVLAFERHVGEAIEAKRRAEIERIERERAAEAERVERERVMAQRRHDEAIARHREFLAKDLDDKLARWRRAKELRAFLQAVEATVPETERDDTFVAWTAWVAEHARNIDPVSGGKGIALRLQPPNEGRQPS